MDARPRIYLAGPDVFFRNAGEIFARKKKICAEHGLEGMSPLDNEIDPAAPGAADSISQANESLMRSCDALIANLSPFRGISADVGTAFELGYMRGLGRVIAAYSNDARDMRDRVATGLAGVRLGADGVLYDADGSFVEHFGFHDNLMLEGALRACGQQLVVVQPGEELQGFAECARRVAMALAERAQGPKDEAESARSAV